MAQIDIVTGRASYIDSEGRTSVSFTGQHSKPAPRLPREGHVLRHALRHERLAAFLAAWWLQAAAHRREALARCARRPPRPAAHLHHGPRSRRRRQPHLRYLRPTSRAGPRCWTCGWRWCANHLRARHTVVRFARRRSPRRARRPRRLLAHATGARA